MENSQKLTQTLNQNLKEMMGTLHHGSMNSLKQILVWMTTKQRTIDDKTCLVKESNKAMNEVEEACKSRITGNKQTKKEGKLNTK